MWVIPVDPQSLAVVVVHHVGQADAATIAELVMHDVHRPALLTACLTTSAMNSSVCDLLQSVHISLVAMNYGFQVSTRSGPYQS